MKLHVTLIMRSGNRVYVVLTEESFNALMADAQLLETEFVAVRGQDGSEILLRPSDIESGSIKR